MTLTFLCRNSFFNIVDYGSYVYVTVVEWCAKLAKAID